MDLGRVSWDSALYQTCTRGGNWLEEEDDVWGPPVRERKKRGGAARLARMLLLGPGVSPVGLHAPLFKLFSIFCFFNSFITFAIKLQMTSNQLPKFSIIQSNLLNQ
jgi:hypothetical protein